jgi:hypothetical protein
MEIWKQVVGAEGRYEVSDLGRVRSVAHQDRLGRCYREKVLKISYGPYAQVCLSLGGELIVKRVHLLVADAFIGTAGGLWVLHFDDDKKNCALSNLRHGNPTENIADSRRNGRYRGFRRAA